MSDTHLKTAALDVVIVNYNAGSALRTCVDSVLASEGLRTRCIIIDNASVDNSLQLLDELSGGQINIIRNGTNTGFSSAVNQGIALSDTPFVMLLNPDTFIPKNSLYDLIACAKNHPQAGVLGGLVLNPDGSEQRGCRRDQPTPLLTLAHGLRLHKVFDQLEFNHTLRPLPQEPQVVGSISGACMLIRRLAHEDIAGFDTKFFLHFEDLDYCARMALHNWNVLFVPFVKIEHIQGVSSAHMPLRVILHKNKSMLRFFYKHGGWQRILIPFLAPLVAAHACGQILSTLIKRLLGLGSE